MLLEGSSDPLRRQFHLSSFAKRHHQPLPGTFGGQPARAGARHVRQTLARVLTVRQQ